MTYRSHLSLGGYCVTTLWRGLVGCSALAFGVTLPGGVLRDIYNEARTASPVSAAAEFELKAAEQNVNTQSRLYRPRFSAQVRELLSYQDVSNSTNTAIFQEGSDSYGVTRVLVEMDKPLIDPTIKPRIDAARSRLQQQQYRSQAAVEYQTRDIIIGFLRAARLQELTQSVDRVIARLEKELEAVTKSHEAKVATVTDLQNIRLSLAGMKRDRNSLEQQLRYELAAMGATAQSLKGTALHLSPGADLAALFPAVEQTNSGEAAIGILTAEAEEISQKAAEARRRDLPTLSLYAQYGLDYAAGSVFGGRRDLSGVEVGVVLNWNIFDRGINRSEAKEFEYRRRAKEAELAARQTEQARNDAYGRSLLSQAGGGIAELSDLVQQHDVLQQASARAYAEGKESYLNSLTAYLAFEAALRELIGARHDQLMRHVSFYARSAGWNQDLVEKVDGLFASVN